MTFAEFQIRLFAWTRMQNRDWEKVRILAWYSYVGSHVDPKKLPSSITSFMPIDTDKKQNVISEAHIKRFKEVTAEYEKQLKLK
jgi:hypothetical protein